MSVEWIVKVKKEEKTCTNFVGLWIIIMHRVWKMLFGRNENIYFNFCKETAEGYASTICQIFSH